MAHPSGAARFVCTMDLGQIPGVIGQETGLIPFTVRAIKADWEGRAPADQYFGPGTGGNIINQDLENGYGSIAKVFDANKVQLAGSFTGPFFPGGTWKGHCTYIPKKSSGGVPGNTNAITFGVGWRDFTNYLMGDPSNWCLVPLAGATPPAPATRCPMCGQPLPPGMGG